MASFTPQNPPKKLTMLDVNSAINSLGAPAKSCRFAVRISPVGQNNFMTSLGYSQLMRDMTYLCEATELPGRGFDFIEARYYGAPFKVPRNTTYDTISMTFLCRQQSFERQMFDDWLEVINPTNIWDFNYPNTYQCKIDLFQLAEYNRPTPQNQAPTEPEAMYQWSLYQAWPMLVNPQPVNWAEQDILRLQVSFAYRYWSRPGRDTDSTAGNVVIQPNL